MPYLSSATGFNRTFQPSSRQTAALGAAAYQARQPSSFMSFESGIRKELDDLAHQPGPIQAMRRVAMRTNVEQRPDGDVLKTYVDQIDPVIAASADKKTIVTRATIVGWDQENGILGRAIGVAPPRDFLAEQTRRIGSTFGSMPQKQQAALMNADRDVSLLNYVYGTELSPKEKPQAIVKARAIISGPSQFGQPLADASADYFDQYLHHLRFQTAFFGMVNANMERDRGNFELQIQRQNQDHQNELFRIDGNPADARALVSIRAGSYSHVERSASIRPTSLPLLKRDYCQCNRHST